MTYVLRHCAHSHQGLRHKPVHHAQACIDQHPHCAVTGLVFYHTYSVSLEFFNDLWSSEHSIAGLELDSVFDSSEYWVSRLSLPE